MHKVQYILRDINPAMVKAWGEFFQDTKGVSVSQGDILEMKADAIVSPANSFGYMDGGIDEVYSDFFGPNLQRELQILLSEKYSGELPVGQAVIIPTHHTDIPFLVSAPTMRVPMRVSDTLNAYLAFRAVIQAVELFNMTSAKPIYSVLCPGLATLTGRMPPRRVAYQMLQGYSSTILIGSDFHGSMKRILENQDRMLTIA